MAHLDWLERSVAASLADASIGQPVAVRLFLALSEDHGALTSVAGAGVAMAGRWFGEPLGRLLAQGSARDGQVSVQATFAGRTALVSAELVRPGGRREARLLILGQKGSLSHEDEPGADGLRVDVSPPAAQRETELVERSLRERTPVPG